MALPCNNLNLNLYRVFYTVAKTKSFSESSRTLHISQPAISKHIQNLEYELKTLLFYRTNRGIELTAEAKALLVYVEKAYNYLMLGERELQESKEFTKGAITIGAPTYISHYYLNNYVKKFMRKYPNIVIKIINKDENTLLELFLKHSLDLLIIPEISKVDKDYKIIEFTSENYCFAYNDNIFGNLDNINLDDLLDKNLLLPSKKSRTRKILEEKLGIKGLAISPIMELDDVEMMTSCIKDGLGIGYIPKEVALANNLKIVELENCMINNVISLLYNESALTNSSKEFINILTDK